MTEHAHGGTLPRRSLRRVLAVAIAATYFGWVWVTLSILWDWRYGVTGASVSEWWAIEGESLIYAVALLGPAVLLMPLAIGVLLTGNRSLIQSSVGVCVVQIPLLLYLPGREAGTLVELIPVGASLAATLIAVGVGVRCLRVNNHTEGIARKRRGFWESK